MPAKKKAKPAFVLRYVGREPFRGVPARSLSEADLARLAYQRAMTTTGPDGFRPDPRSPDPALIEKITAELIGSGLYTQED